MIKTTGVKYQPQGIPVREITSLSPDYPRGYHAGDSGGLPAIEPNLVASNIRWGTTVFGILGTMVRWGYDLQMPGLVIPLCNMALSVLAAHSVSNAENPSLSIPVPAISATAEIV